MALLCFYQQVSCYIAQSRDLANSQIKYSLRHIFLKSGVICVPQKDLCSTQRFVSIYYNKEMPILCVHLAHYTWLLGFGVPRVCFSINLNKIGNKRGINYIQF